MLLFVLLIAANGAYPVSYIWKSAPNYSKTISVLVLAMKLSMRVDKTFILRKYLWTCIMAHYVRRCCVIVVCDIQTVKCSERSIARSLSCFCINRENAQCTSPFEDLVPYHKHATPPNTLCHNTFT